MAKINRPTTGGPKKINLGSQEKLRVDRPPRLSQDGRKVIPRSGQLAEVFANDPNVIDTSAPVKPAFTPGTMREPIDFDSLPPIRGMDSANARVVEQSGPSVRKQPASSTAAPTVDGAAALRKAMADKDSVDKAAGRKPAQAVKQTTLKPRHIPLENEQSMGRHARMPSQQPEAPTTFTGAAPRTATAINVRESACPSGYTRQSLPSNGVFYDRDVFIRPLQVTDLMALLPGLNALDRGDNSGLTAVFDALNNCVVQDIRDLSDSDLRFLLFWQKINSNPRAPYTVHWTSTRYGNKNSLVIRDTSQLEIIPLTKMTRQEYLEYNRRGVRIPTVRDSEAIKRMPKSVGEADRWLAQRAQYVYIPPEREQDYVDPVSGEPMGWFESRMARLREPDGMELLATISEFADKIEHGVIETVEAQDEHFDPEKAVTHLTMVKSAFEQLIEEGADKYDPMTILNFHGTVKDYGDEADEIKKAMADIAAGVEGARVPEPRKEVVQLTLTLADFFPAI